ncbi:hypothetical protein Ssi03_77550 [Sphaerisporangium siamense]|nr:hypothetical protein Ssi03_77550 [Sphaerisporangium siamense]
MPAQAAKHAYDTSEVGQQSVAQVTRKPMPSEQFTHGTKQRDVRFKSSGSEKKGADEVSRLEDYRKDLPDRIGDSAVASTR